MPKFNIIPYLRGFGAGGSVDLPQTVPSSSFDIVSSLVGFTTTFQSANFVKADTDCVSNSSIVFGDVDWWANFKVKFNSIGFEHQLFTKQDSGATNEFWMRLNPSSNFDFSLKNGTDTVSSAVTAITDVWYDVYLQVDKTGGNIGISINNETLNTATKTATPSDTSSDFRIGCINTGLNAPTDSNICAVRCGTGTLSEAQRTELYNGGGARALKYSSISSGIETTIFGAWEMALNQPSSGNEYNDQSGNGYNLINNGTTLDGSGVSFTT